MKKSPIPLPKEKENCQEGEITPIKTSIQDKGNAGFDTPTYSKVVRRTYSDLGELLLKALALCPKSTFRLAKECRMEIETAQFQLSLLEKYKLVERFVDYIGKRKATYWRLKNSGGGGSPLK